MSEQGKLIHVTNAQELAAALAGADEPNDCAVLPSGAVVHGEAAEVIHTLEEIIERKGDQLAAVRKQLVNTNKETDNGLVDSTI